VAGAPAAWRPRNQQECSKCRRNHTAVTRRDMPHCWRFRVADVRGSTDAVDRRTPQFVCSGTSWRVLLRPRGATGVGLFLEAAAPPPPAPSTTGQGVLDGDGGSVTARFQLFLVHQDEDGSAPPLTRPLLSHTFSAEGETWGYEEFAELGAGAWRSEHTASHRHANRPCQLLYSASVAAAALPTCAPVRLMAVYMQGTCGDRTLPLLSRQRWSPFHACMGCRIRRSRAWGFTTRARRAT
jgi:hypothetical protein